MRIIQTWKSTKSRNKRQKITSTEEYWGIFITIFWEICIYFIEIVRTQYFVKIKSWILTINSKTKWRGNILCLIQILFPIKRNSYCSINKSIVKQLVIDEKTEKLNKLKLEIEEKLNKALEEMNKEEKGKKRKYWRKSNLLLKKKLKT